MTVRFVTLGCKVNQYETEVMWEQLEGAGFSQAKEGEAADVVVVNSCTVTAQSDQKARQAMRRAKKDNPGAIGVLTGCWPQAFPEEAGAFGDADVVLGTVNRGMLAEKIWEYKAAGQRVVAVLPHEAGEPFEPMQAKGLRGRTRAFLKIEDGCNRFCSYCIIPYARGRVRSKPLGDMVAEARALAGNGYKEIVLTGINLPAYGQDMGLDLCDAVEAVCGVEGICRVRLGSLEPEKLTEETLKRFAAQGKLCPQFHLSLQSGCGATLRRMNRHYTPEEYRGIVEGLRRWFPGCAITTDVMVGFAGETEEEFRESLDFVKGIGFAKVHVFAYSRRPGTKAYDAPGQVSHAVKEARSREMIACTEACQRAYYQGQVGQVYPVLFEREVEKNVYEGYTPQYTPVRAAWGKPLQGQVRPVKLTGLLGDGCTGELANPEEKERKVF